MATGARDLVFQGTGGLLGAFLKALSHAAMGTRGDPLSHSGGVLSIVMNSVVGVPYSIYAGHRLGLIYANAAPQSLSGPRARTVIRIVMFLIVALGPLAAAASLAATVEADEEDLAGEQLFQFFGFLSAVNAGCAGKIFRDTQNHLARGLMPIAVLRDRHGEDMADSPDYVPFHALRLGLLLTFYVGLIFVHRQMGQTLLQDAFGLPVVERGSFGEIFGSSAGQIAAASIVECIDGLLGPWAQRLALKRVDGSVGYRPATGEFLSLFNTREAAARSLDTIVVNGLTRTSFFYPVDPLAAFAARSPVGSAMRIGLQIPAVAFHSASEFRGWIAHVCLTEEDRQRVERALRATVNGRRVQNNDGESSNRAEPSISRPGQPGVESRLLPNSENVYYGDPDEVRFHTSLPMSMSRSWRRRSFSSAMDMGSIQVDGPDARGEIPNRWLQVPPLDAMTPRASASLGAMHLHVPGEHQPVPAAAERASASSRSQTEQKNPPPAPRRPAPRLPKPPKLPQGPLQP